MAIYTITPPTDGHYVANPGHGFVAGDVLQLRGTFKSCGFYNLVGTAASPITVQNYPGEVATVGDPTWNGGPYAEAMVFYDSHNVVIQGTTRDRASLVISHSTQTSRDATRDLQICQFSDNFMVRYMTIQNGGNGIFAKTEVIPGDATTYRGGHAALANLTIHDVTISGTYNEGMYIGHTATWWQISTNAPFYPANAADNTALLTPADYKKPLKWQNVKIYNCLVQNGNVDGIQTASIDSLEVYGCEVINWATRHVFSDNGGILVGGDITSSYIHDNYIHDGWGEMIQIYAAGGGTHRIFNNLLYNVLTGSVNEGVSMRPDCGANFGNTAGAIYQLKNNTIIRPGEHCLRFNGYFDQSPQAHILQRNLLVEPSSATIYTYTENGASFTEGTGTNQNKKFSTLSSAQVDASHYYKPLPGSTVGNAGYRKGVKGVL